MNSARKLALAMGLVAVVGCGGVEGLQGPQGPEGERGEQGPAGTSPVTDVQTVRFGGNMSLEGSEELRILLGFSTPGYRITVTKPSWVILDASMGFRKFTGTVGIACKMDLLADDEVTPVSIDSHEASVFMMNEETTSGEMVDMRTDGTISLHASAYLLPGNYVPVARCSILPGTTDKLGMSESWLRIWISSR
ncbi:hypothetical protein [Archangium violaceum]|uniref:hypothetical protein n=1 Tax=Archangium violaceum TaxID=83451 RepID=UPI0036D89425